MQTRNTNPTPAPRTPLRYEDFLAPDGHGKLRSKPGLRMLVLKRTRGGDKRLDVEALVRLARAE